MKQYSKYIKEWQLLSIKLNEAMQKDNFEEADRLISECNRAYDRYKECCSYPSSNREMSFGELNYMLESELPNLFQHDKKALKDITNLIREDVNLRSQFKFLDSLRKYNCEGDSMSYVRESVELASKDINRRTLRESRNKLADKLASYEIGGYKLDEDTVRYYRDCDKVLCEGRKLQNLTEHTNSLNSIASYIESHKAPVVESRSSFETMTEELEKKIANLSEEEQSLVKDIIDFKQPMIESRQEKLFNRFKNECLDTIGKLVRESKSEDDVEGLNSIRLQLEEKSFCKETIIQDIAKLLEIRDILLDK